MPLLSGIRVCPISVAVFVVTAVVVTRQERQRKKKQQQDDGEDNTSDKKFHVVFVLGDPGSGKGTQCQLLTERLTADSWVHLSAGDLLRAAKAKPDNEWGTVIRERQAAGQLVPSTVTCQLIKCAMEDAASSQSGVTHFLIDGFPRSFENLAAWDTTCAATAHTDFVINFQCPEQVLVDRLLARGKASGRDDDANLEVIRKRFKTAQIQTAPIIDHYVRQGKLRSINSNQPVDDVYCDVAVLFL